MSDPTNPEEKETDAPTKSGSSGLKTFLKALVALFIAGLVLAMLAFGACLLMLR